MKKWPILAAALLLALAGSQKFIQRKASERSGSLYQEPAHGGVPVQGGDARYSIPAEFSSVPSRYGALSTFGALPTIKDKAYDTGPCKGGSLNEMFSAHGRIWGHLARHASFLGQENAVVYDLLARYLACMARERGSPAFCDYLPAVSRGGKAELERLNTPHNKCLEYYRDPAAPGTAASCSALLAKLGSSYCGYLAAAQKRARGYAGFSPEELQEALKKKEEEKAAAEAQRLEDKRTTEEINKRVRSQMGKPDAPR